MSWVLRSEKEGWLSLARRGLVEGATRVGGRADGKANIERLCLPPYVEKPFNSKVIKSFVPELRSRKCFSCFGIPMFYVYMLWTLYVRFTYSCMAMVHKQTNKQTINTRKEKIFIMGGSSISSILTHRGFSFLSIARSFWRWQNI